MAKGDDMQARLVAFAGQAMDMCERLPKTTAENHIAGQLLRSATSAASDYAGARGAESKSDFIHTLGLVFKELNESEVWLTLIFNRKMSAVDGVAAVLEEGKTLCRIVAAIRRTARNGQRPAARQTEKPENNPG